MAACGSLQQIFQKPLPENSKLFDSLSSWKQIISMKPVDDSSFTEIFGELHFKENIHHPESSSSSPLPTPSPSSSFSSSSSLLIDLNPETAIEKLKKDKNDKSSSIEKNNKSPQGNYYPGTRKKYNHSDSFSSMNSDSLSLCTEGLGSESSDDLEDLKNDMNNIDWQHHEERTSVTKQTPSENLYNDSKRSRKSVRVFPPPISCISRSGKPWVNFKSYRLEGRFILKEVRVPTQDLILHASREDGRLKLQFIHSSDDVILEEDEEAEEGVEEGDEEED